MKIIIEKILKKYSWEQLKGLFSEGTYKNLRKSSYIPLPTISKEINLQEIGYSYLDFLEDYEVHYLEFKEKEIVFNVMKSGLTLFSLEKKTNATSYRLLKTGLRFDSTFSGVDFFINFIEKNDFITESSKFEILVFENHCELYGSFEELDKFKEKYKLKYPVILNRFNNKQHLAFDGLGFLLIKREKEASS